MYTHFPKRFWSFTSIYFSELELRLHNNIHLQLLRFLRVDWWGHFVLMRSTNWNESSPELWQLKTCNIHCKLYLKTVLHSLDKTAYLSLYSWLYKLQSNVPLCPVNPIKVCYKQFNWDINDAHFRWRIWCSPYIAINTTLNIYIPFFIRFFSFLVDSTLGNETVPGIRFLPQGHFVLRIQYKYF